MAEKFSLKDHLFNAQTVGQLAAEFAAGVPGFDAPRFARDALSGFGERELLARLEWMADKLEEQLATDFETMADQLEAALPARLDPDLRDDDFGQFIHACPGILAVRHGLDHHRDRAMALLYAATQRFSMEFYIRPFLNRWPQETMAQLEAWAADENYHVRRLVSEGTRPRLPWARKVSIDPMAPIPLLSRLHADRTRYVTRSVANHLNDIAKIDPGPVLSALKAWKSEGRQDGKELEWMTRHALRSLIKEGHPQAMELLGYRPDPAVQLKALSLSDTAPRIGDKITVELTLEAARDERVIVDYVMYFQKANGTQAPKVFKMKDLQLAQATPVTLKKTHTFKGDATTFRLYPGAQRLEVQVNGQRLGGVDFTLG